MNTKYLYFMPGLMLCLLGCQSLTTQQKLWLDEGKQAYEQQRYAIAIERLNAFLSEVDQVPQVPEALYIRALAAARSGKRDQAYSDLSRAAQLAPPESEVYWRVHVVLGTLHFEDRQWAAAAQAFAEAAANMPTQQPKDVVLFRLGVSRERLGEWELSRVAFRQLRDELPDSTFAKAARRRLQLNANHFAVQCGAFGKQENADNFALSLERAGLAPYIREEPRGRVMMHVVLVGRTTSYTDVQNMLEEVRDVVPDAVIWP